MFSSSIGRLLHLLALIILIRGVQTADPNQDQDPSGKTNTGQSTDQKNKNSNDRRDRRRSRDSQDLWDSRSRDSTTSDQRQARQGTRARGEPESGSQSIPRGSYGLRIFQGYFSGQQQAALLKTLFDSNKVSEVNQGDFLPFLIKLQEAMVRRAHAQKLYSYFVDFERLTIIKIRDTPLEERGQIQQKAEEYGQKAILQSGKRIRMQQIMARCVKSLFKRELSRESLVSHIKLVDLRIAEKQGSSACLQAQLMMADAQRLLRKQKTMVRRESTYFSLEQVTGQKVVSPEEPVASRGRDYQFKPRDFNAHRSQSLDRQSGESRKSGRIQGGKGARTIFHRMFSAKSSKGKAKETGQGNSEQYTQHTRRGLFNRGRTRDRRNTADSSRAGLPKPDGDSSSIASSYTDTIQNQQRGRSNQRGRSSSMGGRFTRLKQIGRSISKSLRRSISKSTQNSQPQPQPYTSQAWSTLRTTASTSASVLTSMQPSTLRSLPQVRAQAPRQTGKKARKRTPVKVVTSTSQPQGRPQYSKAPTTTTAPSSTHPLPTSRPSDHPHGRGRPV